jgi:hypothetical protein
MPSVDQISAPPVPVHVIVDHVPVIAGLPIWATTLISAGIGALFGIVSGLLMEIIKPAVQHFFLKRRIRPQLMAEIDLHLEKVKVIVGDKAQPSEEIIMAHTFYLTRVIDQSRFRYYLEEEPLAVYDIDGGKHLQNFYDTFQNEIPELKALVNTGEVKAASLWSVCLNAVTFGEMFLDRQKAAVD